MEGNVKVKKLFLYFVYEKSLTKEQLQECVMLDNLVLSKDIQEFWSACNDIGRSLARMRGYDRFAFLGTSPEEILESSSKDIAKIMKLSFRFDGLISFRDLL